MVGLFVWNEFVIVEGGIGRWQFDFVCVCGYYCHICMFFRKVTCSLRWPIMMQTVSMERLHHIITFIRMSDLIGFGKAWDSSFMARIALFWCLFFKDISIGDLKEMSVWLQPLLYSLHCCRPELNVASIPFTNFNNNNKSNSMTRMQNKKTNPLMSYCHLPKKVE